MMPPVNRECRLSRLTNPQRAAILICALVIAGGSSFAFQDVQRMIDRLRGQRVRQRLAEDMRLTPMIDRDAEAWLKRALEATERGDWKLAADTLSRIIDEYGDRTISLDDGQRYVSAARAARDVLAEWPKEGLEAYRLLYDAEAQQLLNRARADHDLNSLRHIARRFALTSVGPDAIDLLIDWLLDAGQGAESVDLIEQLRTLPGTAVPEWKNSLRLALAFALSDQQHRARELVAQMRSPDSDSDVASGTATARPLPADWDARIDAVAAFIERTESHPFGESLELQVVSWPQMLGFPATGGRMPALEPTVTPEDIWRDTLPGTQRLDYSLVQQVSMLTGRPPVWECVSDGRNLFYSCPEGVLARDLATFDLLWQSVPKGSPRDPRLTAFRVSVGTTDRNPDDRLDELTTMTLFHDYRGAISCGLGLVFAVEQFGTMNERFPTKQGVVDPNDSYAMGGSVEANSIRAFEADSGRAVWTRGRGGPQDDELKFAHFFGPPIVSGRSLLAVYQTGEDLNLAVLEADGNLVRRILLGSGRAGMFPMNGVLQPTVHDGTVFIPTGAGMFIALNAFDYSLRWLAAYDRVDSNRRQGNSVVFGSTRVFAQPDEWVSSPPVVAGGLVVVAPHDSDKLLAFNRHTGELAWEYDRGTSRYIVGADSRQVLIGGQQIAAIDVESGTARWINSDAQPTGRAIICGDEVFVPTSLGLSRISLDTGRETKPPSFSRDPLGNLFAIDGALYSISADFLNKYADVEKTRAAALLALKNNPDDLSAVLRLAWLAAMEREWEAALRLLDRADELSKAQADEEMPARIAHQRVDVLLNLAAESELSQRGEIIKRAATFARRADDRIRVGLAECDLLIGQKSPERAILRAMDLARVDGDETVRLEQHLDARTTVTLHDRILRAWREAGETARTKLQQATIDLARTALADGHANEAVRIGDAIDVFADRDAPEDLKALAARVNSLLGDHFAAARDPETAIYYWERAGAGDEIDQENLPATLQLAAAYLSPGPGLIGSPHDAHRNLTRIPERLHARPLPPELRALATELDVRTVGEAVAALEQRLPHGLRDPERQLPQVLRNTPALTIVGQDDIPHSVGLRDTASFLDPTRPSEPFAELIPMVKLSQVFGVQVSGAATNLTAWSNDLGPVIEDQPVVIRDWMTLDARPAAIAGLVGVLPAGARICAVGLATGRLMWPSLFIEGDGSQLPQPPVVHVGGMVVIATHANTLIGVPARQGAYPIWRRQFPGRPLSRLDVVGDRIVAIDAGAENLSLLHPGTGRIQRQYGLLVPSVKRVKEAQVEEALKNILKGAAGVTGVTEEELDVQTSSNFVSLTGGVVCRSGESRVVGRDVATGRTIWEHPFTDLITGILPLNEAHFGICRGRHRMAIVRADTGAIVKDLHVPGLQVPPLDAVLDPPPAGASNGGDRVMFYTRTSNDPPRYVLASFPIREGDMPWQHELGPIATVSKRMMRASPDYIAAVAYEFPPNDQPRQQRPFAVRQLPTLASARLFVFDKGGERRLIQSPFAFPVLSKPDDRWYSGLISDVAIFDDRIVAIGPDGYYVLGPAEEQAALGMIQP